MVRCQALTEYAVFWGLNLNFSRQETICWLLESVLTVYQNAEMENSELFSQIRWSRSKLSSRKKLTNYLTCWIIFDSEIYVIKVWFFFIFQQPIYTCKDLLGKPKIFVVQERFNSINHRLRGDILLNKWIIKWVSILLALFKLNYKIDRKRFAGEYEMSTRRWRSMR